MERLTANWWGRFLGVGVLGGLTATLAVPFLRDAPWLRGRATTPAAKRAARTQPPAVIYRKVVANGVPVHLVQIDATRPEVSITVATAGNGIGSSDSWGRMLDRTQPVAAVTGTYFCPQSALPVGTIVTRGETVCEGLVGTAFAHTRGGKPLLIACAPGVACNWSMFDTVLRAGPRLVVDGRFEVWPRDEGFRDPAITGLKRRTAIGITRSGKVLLAAVEKPVRLGTLATVLHHLGARQAMCLDGGNSAGLYYRGKTWVKPRRSLTNLLVVYDSPARYDRYAEALNPEGPQFATAPSGQF